MQMIQKVCNLFDVMTFGSLPREFSTVGNSIAQWHSVFVAIDREGNYLHKQLPIGSAVLATFNVNGNWRVNCCEMG
jgi:hypothetical protein